MQHQPDLAAADQMPAPTKKEKKQLNHSLMHSKVFFLTNSKVVVDAS
jgi:hypothetical protein